MYLQNYFFICKAVMLLPLYTLKNTLFFSCTAEKIKYKKLDVKITTEKNKPFFIFKISHAKQEKKKQQKLCD
ncbi:hypothetical protein ATZ36_11965 [Candidatus Endomicrobiellum trichonymphae]|uniref:Uncharacterized protein n=1 Tax=Endomicrobium trichonymphae TaxID=1408204 RepID=A0A1E5IN38_ENDTX|nr:hypothetical protein ATZ36_11965 [Candidatus Endomicrobium trichonymphae]